MKTQLRTILSITMMAIASATYAGMGDTHISVRNDAKRFSIHNNTSSAVSIRIINEEGKVLYSENNKGKAFAKAFDMKGLAKGEYVLQIEDDQKIHNYPVTVSYNNLVIDKANVTTTYKPSVLIKGRAMDISMLLNGATADIVLYNSVNEQLVNTTAEGRYFSKRFNLSKLEKGSYTLKVGIDGQTFYKTVVLN